MVEDTPNGVQNSLKTGKGLRLGLYEGIPAIQRGTGYNLVAPDKITIFQDAIELIVRSDIDIERKVQEVVLHEIAHHFGLDDRRLDEISAEKRSKSGRP
jgi:predicted Zn-dependent protease with MMP-like domain